MEQQAMKYKRWLVPVVFTLMAIFVVWLAVSNASPASVRGVGEAATRWNTGWQARSAQGGQRALSLPCRLAGRKYL